MLHSFSRTELLLGKEAMEKLYKSKIAVFGVGGVGSFVVEGLVRSGVGNFILVDNDLIDLTNINRQLHATRKTLGKPKVEVMKQRILEINPKAEVEIHQTFFLPETSDKIIDKDCQYIVDAIDTVTGKIELVLQAKKRNIPIISCLGAGNKLDPTRFQVDDIYNTSICPLAKVMRKELKKRGVESLKVVYSQEPPIKLGEERAYKEEDILKNKDNASVKKRQIPGSISFVPSVAGLIIAGEVVKDLIS